MSFSDVTTGKETTPIPGELHREDLRGLVASTNLNLFHDVPQLREWRRSQSQAGRSVALVPTMGALHDGHLELMQSAARLFREVCVSIYVNPTQFGVTEDLSSYPRTWDSDIAKINKLNLELVERGQGRITAIFNPSTSTMYPGLPPTQELDGHGSFVTITPHGSILEGAARPTFFRGVTTVCMKLFNIVQPDAVFFGQKDIQQLIILQRMVDDFHMPYRLYINPTTRNSKTNLALSSRNIYLGSRRLQVAPLLFQTLEAGRKEFKAGQRTRSVILGAAMEFARKGIEAQKNLPSSARVQIDFDYLSLADPVTLEEVEEVSDRGAVLSGAMKVLPLEDIQRDEVLGEGGDQRTVRLIDNLLLGPIEKTLEGRREFFGVSSNRARDGPSGAV